MFVIELVYNLSVLVALSVISGFLDNRWSSTTHKGAGLQGFLFGTVAILGMLNPLVFDVGLVFDGRSVVISLCALFFGPVAAIISSLMAITLRVYQGGIGAIMGVSVITASALIGVFYHYRRRKRERRISSLFLLYFGLLVHAVMLALTLTLPYQSTIAVIKDLGFAIIILYPLATILIGKILHDQEIKLHSTKALRKSEELFRSLAQSSPVGIYRLSKDGEITFVNERWCEMIGIPSNEAMGKNHISVVSKFDTDHVNTLWRENVKSGKTFSLEFRTVLPDNTFCWLLCQYEPMLDEFGNTYGFVGSVFDIDDRKRTEEKLRLWEDIFKSTRMGIMLGVGENPYFDIFNPALAQMYGFTDEELKGKHISVVFAPEEQDRIRNEIQIAYHKGYHLFESFHIKKKGERFPVLVSITAVKDTQGNPLYSIVNVQDISERVEAGNRLKEERSRLANIIEGTNVGTWEWNVQTGHTQYSERWASMIGYSLEEITPATVDTWQNLIYPEDKPKAMALINDHFDGKTEFYQCEYRFKHKDGSWVWIQDRGKVAQWTNDGKPYRMFGIHIDITERKLWEERLKLNEIQLKEQNEEYLSLNEELIEINNKMRESEHKLKEQNEEYLALNEELIESNLKITSINKDLAEARKKAEGSDKLKSAFLANMSHEIRTPMNAIIGFSEILLRPNLAKEKQVLYTEVLNGSCNQLLGIINDVLDISKIETGQVAVHTGEVNLNKLIRSVQSLFLHNAANKKNKLVINSGLPHESSSVITDESKLNQILTNLVSNAIKFTENGEIEIGYSINNEEIEFYVRDTGVGIDPQNHEYIFERFRQVEMDDTRKYGGTGLGLAICKSFVEMLGGGIWLNSELQKGTTFFFTIPFQPSQEGKVDSVAWDYDFNFDDKIILIAEDEKANFIYIKELIDETRATIIRAHNGQEAIDHILDNPEISIILMDIKMPVLNGIEATKIIKGLNSNIPIIAITAYALAGDKKKFLEAGCNAYITKPIRRLELLQKVAELLANS